MNWVFISIILCSIVQTLVCKGLPFFPLAMLLLVITRIVFFTKVTGANIKSKNLITAEAIILGLMLLLQLVFRTKLELIKLLLYVILSIGCCISYLVDEAFFLYVSEEEEQNE